jgi:hypothetical protein
MKSFGTVFVYPVFPATVLVILGSFNCMTRMAQELAFT